MKKMIVASTLALLLPLISPVRAADDAPCAELCVVGSFLDILTPYAAGVRTILGFNKQSTTVYDLTTILDWGDGQSVTQTTHFPIMGVDNFIGDTLMFTNVHQTPTGDHAVSITHDAPAIGLHYVQSFSVSHMPEPETYVMLLTGLGLMGAVARRRKRV